MNPVSSNFTACRTIKHATAKQSSRKNLHLAREANKPAEIKANLKKLVALKPMNSGKLKAKPKKI